MPKSANKSRYFLGREDGQALVEWLIYSLAVITLWTLSAAIAKGALQRAVADSWSLVAARRALSRSHTPTPGHPHARTDVAFADQGPLAGRRAYARTVVGRASTETRITVPTDDSRESEVSWRSILSSFGFQSFLSWE